MGPGFIPVVLGFLLALVGLVLIVSGGKGGGTGGLVSAGSLIAEKKHGMPDLRGGVAILAAVGAFVLLGHYGGLVPATFACVFIAAMGDRKNTWRNAAALGGAITLAAVLIFHWGLSMQFPLFAWGN